MHTPICAQVYVQMHLHAEACGQQQVSSSISLYLLKWVSHLPWSSPMSRGAIHPAPQILLSPQCLGLYLYYGCRGSEHRFFCLPSTSLTEPSPQPQVNISYIRSVATAGPEGRATHHENVICKGAVCSLYEPFLGEGLTEILPVLNSPWVTLCSSMANNNSQMCWLPIATYWSF